MVYIRRILDNLGVKNASNYIFRLETREIYECLIEHFDMNCKEDNGVYIFYQEELFIWEN